MTIIDRVADLKKCVNVRNMQPYFLQVKERSEAKKKKIAEKCRQERGVNITKFYLSLFK